MLVTRIKTALVLFALVFLTLFVLPEWAWLIFSSALAALAFWEWQNLAVVSEFPEKMRKHVAAVLGLSLLAFGLVGTPDALLLFAGVTMVTSAVFWVLVVPTWLARGWLIRQAPLHQAIGLVLVLPAWSALIALKAFPPEPYVLLAGMAVPWIADIGAYFTGKMFGKTKLAPSISPGKTWEGVAGAAFLMVLYYVFLNALGGIFQVFSLPVLLLLLALSVVGDLFESMIKRQAGVKDSSDLLPGHGGVLDRIDSQLSVLPMVLLLIILAAG